MPSTAGPTSTPPRISPTSAGWPIRLKTSSPILAASRTTKSWVRVWARCSIRSEEVAQPDVGRGHQDAAERHRAGVLHEGPEADRVPLAFRHARQDHVRAGADDGGVAAEVRTCRPRPP